MNVLILLSILIQTLTPKLQESGYLSKDLHRNWLVFVCGEGRIYKIRGDG